MFFHHFTYVRLNESDVFKKIETTLHGDREDIPMCTLVDMDKWRVDKWDKLPNAKDFHTTKHYEKSWHEIKVIEECDLPKTVLGTEIINKWRAK